MFLNLRWHRLHSTGFWSALEIVAAAAVAATAAEETAAAAVVDGWALLATLADSTAGAFGVGVGVAVWAVGVLGEELDALGVVVVVTLF